MSARIIIEQNIDVIALNITSLFCESSNKKFCQNTAKNAAKELNIPYKEVFAGDDYMDMRAESNDLFAKARTGTTIAMINHLLSAIDAAWTAKIHNNRMLKTSMRIEQIYYANHSQPVLSLKFSW